MAEMTLVTPKSIVPLPATLNLSMAAAIGNPGMSSWTALTRRAQLRKGETVLINGATGTSGGLAVRIARHLGAGKIIATGRNTEVLAKLRTRGLISRLRWMNYRMNSRHSWNRVLMSFWIISGGECA